MERPPVMRPNGQRLQELRAGRPTRQVAAAADVDYRTIEAFEAGQGTERFHANALLALAWYYRVPFESLLEPIPTGISACQAESLPVQASA